MKGRQDMTLKTRKPTGAVPWPLVLIEGEEKAGKTWACAEFTASGKVGRCFWIDLGEGAADEYGAIPGADYEVVEHDGSFADLYANVAEIHAIAADAIAGGGKPVVLIIDTMTSEWDLLKDWAADRAKSSRSNRKKLEADPNAEIVITGNLWNDANARHHKLMRLLKTFPGIALMTAHGKAVAVIGADGQPVEGKKAHKVESQKSLGADASCWLRLFREQPGVIVGGRSVHLQFKPGDEPKPLAEDWSLEAIIFDVLKCDPATAHVRDLVAPKPDAVTPEQIRDEAAHPGTEVTRLRELYSEAKRLGYDDVVLINETGSDELLLKMVERLGKERSGQQPPASDPVLTGREDPWQGHAPANGASSHRAANGNRPDKRWDHLPEIWRPKVASIASAADADAAIADANQAMKTGHLSKRGGAAVVEAMAARKAEFAGAAA